MASQTNTEDCTDPSGVLSPYKFSRRPLGSDDVSIKMTHCGICYADVIWTRNLFGNSKYPVVPGHEIAGSVKEFIVKKGKVETFNGIDRDGTVTKGGYSTIMVVHQRYCFKIPDDYPLASAAPLLCAGITVYTPMKRHNMDQPGKSLGVIGLGGLGHMAVKFGKAFGLNVTVLSTSMSKKEEALEQLGADKFVVSSDQDQMKSISKSLDFIVDTASGDHPFDPYMSLLKTAGVYDLVGYDNDGRKLDRRNKSDSRKDTPKVYPQIEVVTIQYANEALERLLKRDVKYRFVIDIENTMK
ncbi:hypothetical protein V6N13_036531 [Hibiscus sabdariffa]|uniref:Enoyl reductase (ER) domain-containing protein n=1 Tax=Hibiscus sabdariffa TaxID=183260 RepID=A0ABR2S6J1_9ROSI